MTLWLLVRSVRHAPRRPLLAALGVAFPVAILAATLFYVDGAVRSMTRSALAPVQVEMRGLATTLNADMTQVAKRLSTVPGVRRVDRFGAADVVVTTPRGRATARLFAVDPVYFRDHPWVRAGTAGLGGGALMNPQLSGAPGLSAARKVSISLPGRGGELLSLPVGGAIDLREAFAWFEIPYGDVQGDIAQVPRAIVIPYASFERSVLPALRTALGPQTAILNPGLNELPPASLEAHITVDHAAYPGDPVARRDVLGIAEARFGATSTRLDHRRRQRRRHARDRVRGRDERQDPLPPPRCARARSAAAALGPGDRVGAGRGAAPRGRAAPAPRRHRRPARPGGGRPVGPRRSRGRGCRPAAAAGA